MNINVQLDHIKRSNTNVFDLVSYALQQAFLEVNTAAQANKSMYVDEYLQACKGRLQDAIEELDGLILE